MGDFNKGRKQLEEFLDEQLLYGKARAELIRRLEEWLEYHRNRFEKFTPMAAEILNGRYVPMSEEKDEAYNVLGEIVFALEDFAFKILKLQALLAKRGEDLENLDPPTDSLEEIKVLFDMDREARFEPVPETSRWHWEGAPIRTLAITFTAPLHSTHDGGLSPGGAIFPASVVELLDAETNTLYLRSAKRLTVQSDGIGIDFPNLFIFVGSEKIREVKTIV